MLDTHIAALSDAQLDLISGGVIGGTYVPRPTSTLPQLPGTPTQMDPPSLDPAQQAHSTAANQQLNLLAQLNAALESIFNNLR